MASAPLCVLSKIQRPASAAIVPRSRLFDRLDQMRRHAHVVWIAAPAGAGKTALLASYVSQHRQDAIWYRLDADDADPAHLLHFLGLAGTLVHAAAMPPTLDARALENLPAFCARFFARLFAPDAPASLLVLDAYDAVPDAPHFHRLVHTLLAALPQHVDAVILSRLDPPPELACLLDQPRIVQLDGAELRLTPAESHALVTRQVRARGERAPKDSAELHERSEGWAAGLTMLVEGSQTGSDASLFAYFASEVFAPCSPATRKFLLHCAVLPRFTIAMACAISGDDEAAACFNHSLRQHLFIEQTTTEGRYRFHGLFRAFLLAQLEIAYADAEARTLRALAVTLLEQAGDLEGCASVLLALGEPAATVAFLERHAGTLATRAGTVLDTLLATLPPQLVAAEPRMRLWRARRLVANDAYAAREDFTVALGQFEQLGDAALSFQAWAGAVACIVGEGRTLGALGRWLERLAQLRARFAQYDLDELPTDVIGTAIAAWSLHTDGSAEQAHWVHQALVRLATVDVQQRAIVGVPLCEFYLRSGDFIAARVIFNELRDASQCGTWLLDEPSAAWLFGAEHGDGCRTANDRPLDQAMQRYHLAWQAFLRGQLADASLTFDLAIMQLRAVGFRFGLACALADHASVQSQLGDIASAHASVAEALALAHSAASALLRYKALLIKAALVMQEDGDPDPLLKQAFGLARTGDIAIVPGWHPSLMATLAARALSAGIEVPFVTTMISERGLRSPPMRPAGWPWELQLFTLGECELLLSGRPFVQTGKGSRRTLDLLKAIAAFGGRDVAIDKLTAALWPDADGDSAKTAFDVALHRLRKLLGVEKLFIVSQGKVSLNAEVCWLDVWELQRRAQEVMAIAGDPAQSRAAMLGASTSLLACYRGAFLADEPDQPWLLPMRERLQRLMARAADATERRLRAGSTAQRRASDLLYGAAD
ncbi:MAG: hypothetical protein ACJ8GW_09680 [Massilia sp.]